MELRLTWDFDALSILGLALSASRYSGECEVCCLTLGRDVPSSLSLATLL